MLIKINKNVIILGIDVFFDKATKIQLISYSKSVSLIDFASLKTLNIDANLNCLVRKFVSIEGFSDAFIEECLLIIN